MTGATSALPSVVAILLGQHLDADVVLAQRHVRAVLLGAADRDEDRGRAAGDPVAELGPREILERDAGARRLRGRDGRQQQQTENQRMRMEFIAIF